MMLKSKDIFKKILIDQKDSIDDCYCIEKINNRFWVGISPDGFPSYLVSGSSADSEKNPGKALSGIKVNFGQDCQIVTNEKKSSGIFNIISCTEENIELRDFFFSFFDEYFYSEEDINFQNLSMKIENLSKLFSYKKNKSIKSIMGLWSELFIIALSKNPEIWAEKWHEQPRSTFDFTFTRMGIDVKSYGSHSREHYFKLEQLSNQSVEQTLILSMCIKENEDGESVFDILALIKDKIESDILKKKIEKQVFKLAGKDIVDSKKFNLDIAKSTILILKGKDIPCIDPKSVPALVSDIKFKVDCNSIEGMVFDDCNQDKITNNLLLD